FQAFLTFASRFSAASRRLALYYTPFAFVSTVIFGKMPRSAGVRRCTHAENHYIFKLNIVTYTVYCIMALFMTEV
ncbi:MAG: hypothetical protein Q4C53_09725, partial [Clostridia bacterium]|nr:hypothetical protein [Clostridia bacterium]